MPYCDFVSISMVSSFSSPSESVAALVDGYINESIHRLCEEHLQSFLVGSLCLGFSLDLFASGLSWKDLIFWRSVLLI